MVRYVALLRGINVSGQKLIKMEDLRAHFVMHDFENITTYIQSGNVIFDSAEKTTEALRKKIEEQLESKLGYAVPVIVRSINELKKVIAANPFADSEQGAGRVYVSFLSGKPAVAAKEQLEALSYDAERVIVLNKEVYLLTESYGNSKFPNTLVEKKLGLKATVRNWNTVDKLAGL